MPPPARKTRYHQRRERPEYDQQMLDLRRTTRVVAGGRRFSFRAAIVIGNRRGRVGLGVAKGGEVASAVEKAVHQAKKEMISVPLYENRTIVRRAEAKFSASHVLLKPAAAGRGLVAGGPVRAIAMLAGIRDLSAKIISRSSNKLNNARAAMKALRILAELELPAAPAAAQPVEAPEHIES